MKITILRHIAHVSAGGGERPKTAREILEQGKGTWVVLGDGRGRLHCFNEPMLIRYMRAGGTVDSGGGGWNWREAWGMQCMAGSLI